MRIYQKAFLDWLCQNLYFLKIFSTGFALWKSVSLPHIVHIVIYYWIEDFLEIYEHIEKDTYQT